MSNRENNYGYEQFLHGGGETGAIIRSIDWSKSSLGHPSTWPQSLRISLGILLNSKFPMFIFWGSEQICFYNDAYRPSLGENGKHPFIMGMPGEKAWPDIWAIIKPLIDEVMAGGSTWSEDQLIPIFRNGQMEDVYWTFGYSPIIDEAGIVGGVLVTCTETTDKIHILKRLEDSKNELEFALDAALMGTWDYNPATNTFKGNDRLKEWFGLAKDAETTLRDATDAIHDNDKKRVLAAITHALDYSSGGSYDIEYTIVNRITKKESIVRAKGKAWFADDKVAYRFNGTLEDVTEQVLARGKVEASEQKVRSLVSSSPFPIGVYVGREMRIELANQAILDIWGKGNDVIGKLYREILPELDNQLVFDQLDQVYTTGIPFHSQNTPITLLIEGAMNTFYFNYSFTPLFDDKGNVYGVMNTAADVTELNIAINKVEASEARFRIMAEGSAILIAQGDETSNATYFSKAWTELTGRPMEQLLEFGWADLIHPDDKDSWLNNYLSAFKIKAPFTGEFRILDARGEYRWLFAKGEPLFQPDGYFYGYISSSIDITERKDVEEKIRESQQQLLSLFEQSPVALAIFDKKEFTFRMANRFYAEIVGRKSEDLIGKPLYEVLPELAGQGFESLLQNVIDTGNPFYANTVPVELLRNGVLETIYVDLSYQPLHAADNSIEGILVVCTDVTQQVLSIKVIEESEQDLRSLVLQAPIGICVLNAETLVSEEVNEQFVEVAGKPYKEIAGKYYWDTFAEAKPHYEKALQEVVETGKPFYANEVELMLIRHGVEEFVFVTFVYSPLKDVHGKVTKIVVWVLDNTLQVSARRKIQENEHRFRTLIEEASVATAFYTGRELTIQYANDLMLGYWGKKHSIIGKPLGKALPELDGQPFLTILDNVFTSGEPYVGVEERAELVVNGESKEFYFNFTYKALKDKNGEIYGIHHMSIDVTEQVKSKAALIESERKFRDNVKQAPVGIAVLRGRDFVVELANSKYLELVDRTEDTLLEKPLFQSLPEVRSVVEPLLNGVLDSGEPFFASSISVMLNRYGQESLGYFNLVYQPLKDENGNNTGIMVVATEVTDSVMAENKLSTSESRFRNLVMQSPIPMTIWKGEDFIIEVANERMFKDLWRKDPKDVIGRKALEVFPELLDQKYPELLRRVMSTGISHTETESEAYVTGDDGTKKFYLDFEYSPLIEADGSITGLMITVTDVTAKVEAREKLQESKTYFERMTDSVPTMIWITNKEGMCTYVNKQWSIYTGQKFEDSLNHGWLATIHPNDRKYSTDVFMESAKNFDSFTIEYRLLNREQEYRWVIVEAVPRFNTNGEFEGYIGTVTDIDDRKSIQEKIKESDERSKLVIEAAQLGTYEWFIGEAEADVSERFAQIFGFTEYGLIDRSSLLDRFHPEDLEIHKKAHENAAETGTLDYEARLIWPDKSVHWIKIRGTAVSDDATGRKKMLGTVMDITGIKNVSKALEVSEARLSEAQRIAGIGNWEYNYVDKTFYCSEEVYRILSTDTQTFVPSFYNLFRMIHPEDIKKLSRTLSFTRKTGLPFNLDFRIITDTEEVKFINSQGYIVTNENNKIARIIGTLQDISMRKLVEEELTEAKQISEKTLKFKEQFLANMSHEIRTPMNAIVGFTGLLQKTPLQTEQKQYLEAIKTSGENLLVIINDILDFSKVEAGAIHFEKIDFKLGELISTLTDLMLPKSVEKGINLSVSLDPKIPDALLGDPTRLNQILINLVGNAIKFTEQGEVKISTRYVAELENLVEIEFSVSDTGIGIDSNMTDAIFDVFTQSSAETTRKYGGSGLGLAIVKQFVERQGGHVWVESELDKGSTFYFTLSFAKSTQTDWEPKPQAEEVQENTSESIKVLLVEDNKLNQLLASKALSDWNWEVIIADNGLIALEKIAKEDFDVILMDIQLPEMDGYEATRYIRNTFDAPKSQTPIIAVTAHAMQSELKKCKEAGMDGYITKPFSPKMLYEGIKQVMDTKKKISIEEQ